MPKITQIISVLCIMHLSENKELWIILTVNFITVINVQQLNHYYLKHFNIKNYHYNNYQYYFDFLKKAFDKQIHWNKKA